jgi:nifR3 family TIM-barrel protein
MTLKVGPYEVWPPVVLAPMAGVTNAPFRTLCREHGAGLYVSEMTTARAVVERNAKTMAMIRFAEGESPRSLQLYGVDPQTMGEAVAFLAGEGRVDHIDLNFGCPVPKVTRRGGGAALPYKRSLLREILRAAVRHASAVPVTMKMRVGIDEEHHTYLDAGRAAQDEGIAAVGLHARTAAQHYSGHADWAHIARLVDALDVPVLGNGDIWTAADALAMVEQTGCAGVVIGRGCLGRPWLFRDLADAFAGRPPATGPRLAEVGRTMVRHAALLADWMGQDRGVRELRKHVAWYLKGFAVGPELRRELAMADTLDEVRQLVGRLDGDQTWPEAEAAQPRGRQGSPRRVALPEGWLDEPDAVLVPAGAELDTSGG